MSCVGLTNSLLGEPHSPTASPEGFGPGKVHSGFGQDQNMTMNSGGERIILSFILIEAGQH